MKIFSLGRGLLGLEMGMEWAMSEASGGCVMGGDFGTERKKVGC